MYNCFPSVYITGGHLSDIFCEYEIHQPSSADLFPLHQHVSTTVLIIIICTHGGHCDNLTIQHTSYIIIKGIHKDTATEVQV